eukprot:206683_1
MAGERTVVESVGYTYITIFVTIIVAPLCIFLVITHLYKFYQHELSPNRPKKNISPSSLPLKKHINILTLIMVLSMGLVPPIVMFQRIICLANPSTCVTPVPCYCYIIMYYVGKLCMYLIFIMRIHAVYGRSAYSYAPWKLKTFAVLIIIIAIFLLSFTIATVTFHYVVSAKVFLGSSMEICDAEYTAVNLLMFGLNEICDAEYTAVNL